jgi:serine/threonine protein phosphatase PrpC
VGTHTLAGQKLDHPNWQNQDLQAVVPLGEARCFAVVFDGHGMWGHIVAAKACEAMVQNVNHVFPEAPAPVSDHEARAGLEKLFALAQAAIEAADVDSHGRRLADFSGTTATAALVDAATGRASVAHVGDSALAAYAHGRVIHRTTDHHVDDEAEQRCRARGGEVREFEISGINVRRLCLRGSQFPGLAMSRALGDLTARDLGLRSDPEVCAGLPFAPGTILVLASDGVWEKTKADVVGARVAGLPPQAAARELVEFARSQWNPAGNIDDITAIVLAGVN